MPNQTRHCKLDLGNPGFRAHHWILRPFFGTPGLEVAFLRADPMRGTFYEIIWRSMSVITSGHPIEGFVALLRPLPPPHPSLKILHRPKSHQIMNDQNPTPPALPL